MLALNVRTIQGQAMFIGVTLVGIVVVMLLASGALGLSALQSISSMSLSIARSGELVVPLQRAVLNVRFDAVQVQQFLSDVSATRAQDGLDDGFKSAEEFAVRFATDIDTAIELSRKLDRQDMVKILTSAKTQFPEFYGLGKKMAATYVSGGPTLGNQLMPAFDKATDTFTEELEGAVRGLGSIISKDRIRADALAESSRSVIQTVLTAVLALAICGVLVAVLVTRRLLAASTLMRRAAEVMKAASDGDLNARIIRINRKDEIGDLLRHVNRLLDLTEAFAKEAGTAVLYASKKKYFRLIVEDGMRGEFTTYVRRINNVIAGMEVRDAETIKFSEEKVLPVIDATTHNTHDLSRTAETLNFIAHQTIESSMLVASAAEQATVNVQSVASAAVELSASIGEINRQVTVSSQLADDAVGEARHTNETVSGLNTAAQKIGDVVKFIRDIAAKTNLLALNATIEAARAGDAGKGFAVVAGEVKTLANQTARATEDITQQVNEMQRIAIDTVKAIESIGHIITHINDNIGSVADAVHAQGEATAEISRNVQEAAIGTGEVAKTIVAVTEGARETESMAAAVLTAAGELARQSGTLQQGMTEFIEKVRTAA